MTPEEKRELAKKAGTMIRMRRNMIGLTQKEAAERLGWSQSKYHLLESGKRPGTSLATYVEVCRELGISMMDVIGEDRHPGDLRTDDLDVLAIAKNLRRHREAYDLWLWVGKRFIMPEKRE